jgi:hypothetical protein
MNCLSAVLSKKKRHTVCGFGLKKDVDSIVNSTALGWYTAKDQQEINQKHKTVMS